MTKKTNLIADFKIDKPKVIYLDTETTGLDIMKDKPFLIAIGWDNKIYLTHGKNPFIQEIFDDPNVEKIWVWNAKYDAHMLFNNGYRIPWAKWNDGIAVAMLAGYTDQTYTRMALKDLGNNLLGVLDPSVKLVEDAFRKLTTEHKKKMFPIKGYSYTQVNKLVNEIGFKKESLPERVWECWVKYKNTPQPTYQDINTDWLYPYAENDIKIMKNLLENFLLPKVKKRNQMKILEFEQTTLEPFWDQERKGIKIDVDYLKNAKNKIEKTVLEGRAKLYGWLNQKINVNQHQALKNYFEQVFNIKLKSVDSAGLKTLREKTKTMKVKMICDYILKLRSLEKWYSTYCLRVLEKIDEQGVLRTSFNLFGAKTGRLTSDFHQFPEESLKDFNGNDIFNVRKMVIPHQYGMAFFDYSEMELRIQAEFTHRFGTPDKLLTSAYTSSKPIDLHLKAAEIFFGKELAPKLRWFGKRIMFAFIYGSGTMGIWQQLKNNPQVKTPELYAVAPLLQGLKQAYSGIADYQSKVRKDLHLYGYGTNLFGRRYYFSDTKKGVYKMYNFLIQGSGAYILKQKIVKVYHWLKNNHKKSFIFLNIHDEIVLSIVKEEINDLNIIKKMLEEFPNWKIPIKVGFAGTKKNWLEKK